MGADKIPLVTWLLYDNSKSVPSAQRAAAKAVLKSVLRSHSPNEKFCLATFSNNLDIPLAEDSQNEMELADKIDAIQTNDQRSYLMSAIDGILTKESGRKKSSDQDLPDFVRILVVSDGGDGTDGGDRTTLNQVISRLTEHNIPVYSIGCGENTQARRDMYELSDKSHGTSWDINTVDEMTVSDALRYRDGERPAQVLVTVPAVMRDGNRRDVQVTFSNGATVSTSMEMPRSNETPSNGEDPIPLPPTPDPPEPKGSPWKVVLIIFLILFLIAGGVLAFLYLRRRWKGERITSVRGAQGALGDDEKTDILSDSDAADDDYTVPLVNDDSHLMLSLIDTDNSDNHFESPLRGKVTIGRSGANQIVVNYDKSVSNRHCEIYLDKNGDFIIHDLNSSNGTYIERNRVVDTAEIANGSVVRLGRLEFRVGIR